MTTNLAGICKKYLTLISNILLQELPLLPVASSPSDVLTATVLGSLSKINDTGGGGGMRLDDEDSYSDNGSANSRHHPNALPIFDLFRSVGESLIMRWDRSQPPDRHSTSMSLEDWNWVRLFRIDDDGLFKRPNPPAARQQCPLRAEYLRNSLSILSGFA